MTPDHDGCGLPPAAHLTIQAERARAREQDAAERRNREVPGTGSNPPGAPHHGIPPFAWMLALSVAVFLVDLAGLPRPAAAPGGAGNTPRPVPSGAALLAELDDVGARLVAGRVRETYWRAKACRGWRCDP